MINMAEPSPDIGDVNSPDLGVTLSQNETGNLLKRIPAIKSGMKLGVTRDRLHVDTQRLLGS